jgi:adenylosuccinate lyase
MTVFDDLSHDSVTKRYSSKEMREIFSELNIIKTWRRCWIALAESEKQLGIKIITHEMIKEMKDNINNIDWEAVKTKEQETQHDVVAHIYAYGLVCPKARNIIHLGESSQFVKCNTDVILQREGLGLIREKLLVLLRHLESLIIKYRSMPTLSYAHYMPAQPTTIGRRFCIYAQDLLTDLEMLDNTVRDLKLRGVKGATGTQSSLMDLFKNDQKKIMKLELLVAERLGFKKVYPISTQTYTRKQDIVIATVLANIAATSKKLGTDLRLLSNLGIIEEPFTETQVGSSATPYKGNPMRSERVCSLSRKVINNVSDFYQVYSEQWLERTLDDSAIRRLDIPQNFLLTEHILDLLINVTSGMIVYPGTARKILEDELPFMASEKIILATVSKGADRNKIKQVLREHEFSLAKHIKIEGGKNDLAKRLAHDLRIGLSENEIAAILHPDSFLGRSVEQADAFVKDFLHPALKKHKMKF